MNGVSDYEITGQLADWVFYRADPTGHKGLNPYTQGCGCDFKKCCKKYKKGKRCKKCPKR